MSVTPSAVRSAGVRRCDYARLVWVRPEIVDALPSIMTLTEATAEGRLSRATKAAHIMITPRERTGACPNNDVFVELGLIRHSTQLRLCR
jgi:hypothetical protein